MNRCIVVLMFAISICANGYSQNKSRTNVTAKTSKSQKRIVKKDVRKKQAVIKFENTDYDFGKVKAGQTKVIRSNSRILVTRIWLLFVLMCTVVA